MLKDGTIVYGIGGGLCQLSNLLFWITIHTPLQVVERHRHGYDVFPDANRKQPFGSGATCFYPYGDLMISNPTDQPFQLRLHVGKTHLHGEWRMLHPLQVRYEIVERNHEMRREWWGGYSRHNPVSYTHLKTAFTSMRKSGSLRKRNEMQTMCLSMITGTASRNISAMRDGCCAGSVHLIWG